MDTFRPQSEVEEDLRTIKVHMPDTYKVIQDKARCIRERCGCPHEYDGDGDVVPCLHSRAVYRLVRRGVAGRSNCFWAMERGRVVGTPFVDHPIEADVALAMVRFGCGFAVVLAEPSEVQHGQA